MSGVRIRRELESETLHLPELKPAARTALIYGIAGSTTGLRGCTAHVRLHGPALRTASGTEAAKALKLTRKRSVRRRAAAS
jgi:hypothetical protein